ncbi:hypothetical protein DRW07_08725 [Alteromonas sediminis]|uniref:Uncharacterized protein n=1 Tax=Alteromonas sediminis TaxID=2259342 RepID=A0A3N5Y3W9_9ALTE|nr:hypothetical protein [Alteromonas sediminis]RPJ67586.1 hypothetical protein DRW07_08725 [Alteromonas sediminis]
MKNATSSSLISLFLFCFCFCFSVFANECKEGQRTIQDWMDFNGSFKEFALPKNLIKSEACFYEPNNIIPSDSLPDISGFIRTWEIENNVLRGVRGQNLVNLIEALASEFDISIEQFCYDAQVNMSVTCEQHHSLSVSTVQNVRENKDMTVKESIVLGRFVNK